MITKVRIDDVTHAHTRFTIFVNGAYSGQLTLRNEEYVDFISILRMGCHQTMDEFEKIELDTKK